MDAPPGIDEPRFIAAVALLERTGAGTFSIRYQDDEKPIVWIAIAGYEDDKFAVAAGLNPQKAVFNLCSEVLDGGHCNHCNRPSAFSEDFDQMLLEEMFCWYQWDPELKTFRRGCEGENKKGETQ
jgi:hypothetical protein